MDFSRELASRASAALGRYQNLERLKKIKSEQTQVIINIKAEIEKVAASGYNCTFRSARPAVTAWPRLPRRSG